MGELNDTDKSYILNLLGYSLKFDSTVLIDINFDELNEIRNYKLRRSLSTELLSGFIEEYLKSRKVKSTQIIQIISKIY